MRYFFVFPAGFATFFAAFFAGAFDAAFTANFFAILPPLKMYFLILSFFIGNMQEKKRAEILFRAA
jgi:amino acid transporter